MAEVLTTERSRPCLIWSKVKNTAKSFIAFITPSAEDSITPDPNVFMFQVIFMWIIICIPSNIFALTTFIKHYYYTKDDQIRLQNYYKKLQLSLNANGTVDIDIGPTTKSTTIVSIFIAIIITNIP